MSERRPAHEPTREIGVRIADFAAVTVAAAFAALARERSICDGYGSRGPASVGGHASGAVTSSTESAALGAEHFALLGEDLADAIDGLRISAEHLERLARKIAGERAPLEVPRCGDAQRKVLSAAHVFKGELDCPALPVRRGFCYRHYFQWYRYDPKNHVDPTAHLAPAGSAA